MQWLNNNSGSGLSLLQVIWGLAWEGSVAEGRRGTMTRWAGASSGNSATSPACGVGTAWGLVPARHPQCQWSERTSEAEAPQAFSQRDPQSPAITSAVFCLWPLSHQGWCRFQGKRPLPEGSQNVQVCLKIIIIPFTNKCFKEHVMKGVLHSRWETLSGFCLILSKILQLSSPHCPQLGDEGLN